MNNSRILPPNTLNGVRVGISVSESADLSRLGLLEGHFRLALGEIARSVLVLGGELAYGGHLDPNGYTPFLVSELKRYARRDRPLTVVLAWSEHRRVSVARLLSSRSDLGLFGRLDCLDIEGQLVDFEFERTDDPAPVTDPLLVERGLTALRRHMGRITQGRVLIGGRRSGFRGAMPGLVEEAIIAIESGQPLYLAGGFGGVTLDVVRTLCSDAVCWMPPDAKSPVSDPRCVTALDKLAATVTGRGWKAAGNGLTDEENGWLAATHRPSEIAALVSLGLGRLAALDRLGGSR